MYWRRRGASVVGLTVTVSGWAEVRDALKRAPAQFRAPLRQAFADVGRTFENEFAKAHLRGRTGPENVAVRTGNLRRNFGHRLESAQALEGMRVHIGFGRPAIVAADAAADRQARAHLFGATIRPVHAKWLWIPVGKNLTRAGVPRFQPRDLPDPIFISRTRHGPDTRAETRGRRRGIRDLIRTSARPVALPRRAGPGWVIFWRGTAMFVLVDHVTIRPRLPLERDWRRFYGRARARVAKGAAQAVAIVEADRQRAVVQRQPDVGSAG